MNFSGKVVVITGGSRGIGEGIARLFSEKGAHVVITYRSNQEKALNIVNNFATKGLAIQADIASMEQCENAIALTIEAFGKIDVLINNAGITKDNLMLRMTQEDFGNVVDVNLKGTWNMIKASTRLFMKQKEGKIINISSVVGQIGNAGQVNYSAAKAGIIGMTKSLAKEFASRGITVNAIAPGFIETDMTSELSDDIKQYYLNNIPLKRLGTVNDIANACLFLASDMANYITGQTLSVNGGLAMY